LSSQSPLQSRTVDQRGVGAGLLPRGKQALWPLSQELLDRSGWRLGSATLFGQFAEAKVFASHFSQGLPPGSGSVFHVRASRSALERLASTYLRGQHEKPGVRVLQLPGADSVAILAEYDELASRLGGPQGPTRLVDGAAGPLDAVVASLLAAGGDLGAYRRGHPRAPFDPFGTGK